jgi:type IV secretion system protein VirB11
VEALNFLEAINTGHPGSISTIHADTPALALERMALMVMQSGLQLTMSDVVTYAKKTIDMIVQVGRVNGQRGVLEIYLPALQQRTQQQIRNNDS